MAENQTSRKSFDLIDEISLVPWRHLSFVMRYFMLEFGAFEMLDASLLEREGKGGKMLFTGSVAEHLYLPFMDR